MSNGILTKWFFISVFSIVGSFILVSEVNADFLKMPEIEQLRQIKEKTLLKDMNIPAVRDRLPDPQAGPRLAVSEFRIQGLVEFPELGITHEAISQLVENIRFNLMAEGKLLKSGYTLDELGEVSDMLVDIEEETIDRHVTSLEVQKLVWLIRAQQGKRGVTIGQIEGVASSITQFYRERGFILAKAYIPKQQVRDGIVKLTVLLGTLGEVSIKNNSMYDSKVLEQVFDEFIDKPVTSQTIEESLFLINNFPGISVDGYFEPGTQVGDTRLNVNVRSERTFNFSTRIDNHGTVDSGLYRLFLDAQVNNVFGIADYIHLSLLQSVFPFGTTYGQLSYDSNFFSPRIRAGFDISENQFVSDQSTAIGTTELSGIVNVYGANLSYIAQRSRKRNSSYEFGVERINSDLQYGEIAASTRFLDQELLNYYVSYSLDLLDDENKLLHDVTFTYNRGHVELGYSQGQERDFNVYSMEYSLLSFINIPFTESSSRLIFKNYLQYSGTTLSSISRYSLTGPTRIRGFTQSYFTGDDAVYIGLDWMFNSPEIFNFSVSDVEFNNVFKPFVFLDYGFGYRYALQEGEPNATANLADIGLGVQISHNSGLSGTVQVAFPVMSNLKIIGEEPEYDSALLSFNIQFSF
ncbi:ShlB/FhaC/HecB family hemolysin secretion/activation protein [Colwellia echini]|uniref:ShlB/FhaC/HecB family hemolysin secretion/activation protein n=1 Tax=Colwellia echini TaxID=1982103 RepID=A0ABY3MTH4_9GAMM|nr:ShlB/FhaC/HecB family hemolysin secretion/activation protein [Colwellia echini]TYK64480.1 ShlB/FhaC/HecB family hemolysin secretion/activation protein [Colwellia echini]